MRDIQSMKELFNPQAKMQSITNAQSESSKMNSNEQSLDSQANSSVSKTTNSANAENPKLATKTTNENPNSESELDASIAPPKTSTSFSDRLKAKAMNYMMSKMTDSKDASPDAKQDDMSQDSDAPRQLTPLEKAKASKTEPERPQPKIKSTVVNTPEFKSPKQQKMKSIPITKPPSFKMPKLR